MGVAMARNKFFPIRTKVTLNFRGKRVLLERYHDLVGEVNDVVGDKLYVVFEDKSEFLLFNNEVEIVNNSNRTKTIEWV